ncbi:guanine deaminase [Cryobacterium sp. MDB1-18-2]|uniref:amidohydrolase family protein n=1 Tax=unclassified Cryobacterium TaxID=2649013 RepID=UPI00106BB23D|nr:MULTISPECIES: amidohydrolase family protein [unclassified Cryobacterium]TFC24961.1 guanine deaminase [Cryobacterium sp. MDB1-18-2]TFC45727.1 guanine deaminase [Cryobacterium sp. MDB1-18-1]
MSTPAPASAASPDPSAVPAPTAHVYRGHVFHIAGSPVVADAREHLVSLPDGALVTGADGRIAWVGPFAALPAAFRDHPVTDNRGGFILPGFVDTHLHYPQTYSTDAYGGGQLLEWLDNCVFPAETRLRDPEFAARIARDFTRRRVAAGTTSALVFGSAFPHAQDALFAESQAAGLRLVSGRGVQTVGSGPAGALLTGEAEALDLIGAEIDRWHAVDTGDPATALLQVAVVPRFSLSVTPKTLAGLGELYDDARERGVYFHSHLNENNRPGTGEIDAVKAVYGVDTYLDTYDGLFLPGSKRGGSSLLGRRSILAHAVHCEDAELARLAETGTSVAHCPTSQQFLGSGTMPWLRTTSFGVNVAIGSDIGAGDEWLISRVLNDCFKVHLSEPGDAGLSLDPAALLFTGTLAGARALDMEARFGNFDVGKDADFLLIAPDRWEPLATVLNRGIRADDERMATDQTLFALLLALRQPAITGVFVRGRRVLAPE